MALFLLGRSTEGALSLLSDQAFDSRQDALAELGRVTADPAFDRWDDEVLLFDLAVGTEILLVRPAAPVPAATVALEDEPEPAEFAAIADEEPEPAEEPAETDGIESEAAEGEGLDAEPAAVEEEPNEDEGADTATDEAEPEAVKDAPTEREGVASVDLDEEMITDDLVDDDVPDEENDEESEGTDSLRDAIARTTEHMEATGIVAPDSIGLAEEPGADAVAKTLEDDEKGNPFDTEPIAPEPESPSWPWDTSSEKSATAAPVVADGASQDVAFVLEGLEEPSIDDQDSLITSTIDDESLAASRPVILGSYADDPGNDGDDAQDAADDDASDEPESAANEAVIPDEESDFIVLDPVAELPDAEGDQETGSEAKGKPEAEDEPSDSTAEEDVLSLSEYTCDDCVYVDTCPNKDQRRPEDCGSFQWK